ncbi:MAG: DUF928 domain-containing protein [Leptolyngbyaceae cyanobacterium]
MKTGRSPFTQILPMLLGLTIIGHGAMALAAPYVPPAGLGAPGRRESAGTRGCGFGNPANLIALMPESNVGLTTAAYPRFYWYMPLSQAQFVRFTLTQVDDTDAAIATLYEAKVTVTGEAGIVSLQLPETVSLLPLVAGERYRWQVSAFCNPQSENGDLQIAGWIERRLPESGLTDELASASDLEAAALYARNGYWFDAVDALAAVRMTDPDTETLQDEWTELLSSVGLEALADQPWWIP